eukprot:scaffold1583_cov105-Isochrysis_galbana.AAC.8
MDNKCQPGAPLIELCSKPAVSPSARSFLSATRLGFCPSSGPSAGPNTLSSAPAAQTCSNVEQGEIWGGSGGEPLHRDDECGSRGGGGGGGGQRARAGWRRPASGRRPPTAGRPTASPPPAGESPAVTAARATGSAARRPPSRRPPPTAREAARRAARCRGASG